MEDLYQADEHGWSLMQLQQHRDRASRRARDAGVPGMWTGSVVIVRPGYGSTMWLARVDAPVVYFEIVSRRVDRSARGNSRADRFGFGLRFLACASLHLEVVDA